MIENLEKIYLPLKIKIECNKLRCDIFVSTVGGIYASCPEGWYRGHDANDMPTKSCYYFSIEQEKWNTAKVL